MRHVRMLGLCLVAVLAVGAVGAGGASARLPEFGKCLATESGKGGQYTDSACIERAHARHGELQGAYEWQPLKSINLQVLGLQGTMAFETASKARVECTAMEASQDLLTGPRTAQTPLWVFEGCSSEGNTCHTAVSVEEGEITNELAFLEEEVEEGVPPPGWQGELGFVSRGLVPVVGMQYTIKNRERAYPPVSCSGGVETIWFGGDPKSTDAFITTLSPVNQMTNAFTESLSESAPGVAQPSKLLGHHRATFYAYRANKWEPMAMVGTFLDPVEEGGRQIEIKATR